MSELALALLAAYLIGSVPTGFLLVRWRSGVDVRTVGSGNIGATNVARAAGKGIGLLVLLLDLGKGLLAVRLVAPWLVPQLALTGQLACGLWAVLGHSVPVWLRFRGGKGVATTIGVLLGAMPLVAALCLGVWLACFVIWRYVSVASLAAALTLPLAQLALSQQPTQVLLGSCLTLLIWARHRANLERLLQGTEHRMRFGAPSSSRHSPS